MDKMPETDADVAVADLTLAASVGKRILALRQRYGLSQRELARRADMTNSTLSTIEQGKVSPSIASLEKILNAIPVSLQTFFSESLEHAPPVRRQHEMLIVKKGGLENSILPLKEHVLNERGKSDAWLTRQVYEPGARVTSEWMVRQGMVGGLIIEGQLTLNLEGTTYVLNAGDGFHFALHRRHTFSNDSASTCTVVSVSFA